MRVIVIGGTGLIGSAIAEALRPDHEVVTVGRSSGDRRADITSLESVRALLDQVEGADAVVCAAGDARFGRIRELSDEDFDYTIRNKLMGQANVIRASLDRLPEGGSVTVTTGLYAVVPEEGVSPSALANGGLEAFARVAALEAPRGIRVNVVRPGWIAETLASMRRDPSEGTPAAVVARTYVAVLEGEQNGEVVEPG